MKILLSTTSYQDTPGRHHEILAASGFDVVRARGPLNESQMLALIQSVGGFDGFLNGDDRITAKVIDVSLTAKNPLKVIAKYGIGLDSIDVAHATAKKIPVLFTPGVNHTTVAEHTFGLMIALSKHFWIHLSSVKAGQWKRVTGTELAGKTLAIFGLGRIGQEVAKRASAFGMNLIGHGTFWDDVFARQYNIHRSDTAEHALKQADVVTLHMHLHERSRRFINQQSIALMKDGALLINSARGGLVDEADVAAACRSGKLGGYAADVLDEEPMRPGHPFQEIDNILITPHVGSRTLESVERQAVRATLNIVHFLKGEKDYIQANPF